MSDYAAQEALYEKIKHKLNDAERQHIADLKSEPDKGYYGHDLYQAIGRAKARLADDAASDLVVKAGERPGWSGKKVPIGLAFDSLYRALLLAGATPDDIRRVMRRDLEVDDRVPRRGDDIQREHDRLVRDGHLEASHA